MPQLKPDKIYFKIIAALFIIALAFGYAAGRQGRESDSEFIRNIFSPYSFLRDLPAYQLFLFIFINNAVKAFLSIFLGLFFGLYTIYFIFINGELIGLVYGIASNRAGHLPALAGLAPHGIFELAAILIAAGYGLWLGSRMYRNLRYKESIKPALASALRTYVRLIVPLLLVAALIETYITPLVIAVLR